MEFQDLTTYNGTSQGEFRLSFATQSEDEYKVISFGKYTSTDLNFSTFFRYNRSFSRPYEHLRRLS